MLRTVAVIGNRASRSASAARASIPAATSDRYAFIDTLRGVACLLVVYVHSVQWLQETDFGVGPWLESFIHLSTVSIDPGKVGVLIFFAISGYVVPFSLLRNRPAPVRDFVVNRFFRLYPIYWLSIVIAIPVVYYFLGYSTTPRTFVYNLTMIQEILGEPHVLRVYWTLQVELIFYTLCVLMFVAGGMRHIAAPGVISLAFLFSALAVAIAGYALDKDLPVGLPLALSLMFFGFAARQLSAHRIPALRLQVNLIIGLYAVLFPVIIYVGYAHLPAVYGSWTAYLMSYYVATAVFVGVVLVRPMSTRLTAWIGRVSYSVYLFHLICIHILGYYLVQMLPGELPGLPFLFVFPVATVLLSHVLYTFVEQPSIRLGRALNRRLG